jgi:hypothetical protein
MNSISPDLAIDRDTAESVASLGSAPHETAIRTEVAAARQRVEHTLLREIEAMVLFALGAGRDVPPEALAARPPPTPDAPPPVTATDPLVRLADLHLTLTKLIAPARGATLVLLADQRKVHPMLQAFGPVPQVRWMLATAVFSLMMLLGTALSGHVNPENIAKGLLNLEGHELILVEMFLVSASAVGATLANLKQLNRYISDCNYDPRYDSSYWSRLVMGMISGVILSQVVFSSVIGSDNTAVTGPGSSALAGFGQPILAILGGFSAELVHDVLSHLIGVIGNALGLRKPEQPRPPADR